MPNIAAETRLFIEAALAGDPALASLSIAGSTPAILAVHIAPGVPPNKIAGSTYSPAPPFTREILVELVVGMQRRRWQRWDDFTLRIVNPDDDCQPLRDRIGVTPEHGPGWFDLIHATADVIERSGGDPRASQIKEKFGTLRWYGAGLEGDIGGQATDAAEHLSGFLCDRCGALGQRRPGGWVRTTCDEHVND